MRTTTTSTTTSRKKKRKKKKAPEPFSSQSEERGDDGEKPIDREARSTVGEHFDGGLA